ncbi:WD repeat-containing protein 43-like isoform X1 [Homarus americanus]|uniref:WD repeat-containing protein 43-like isoform X1 n=2 Tax=Homarus americanus TaxID=6706 RepID=UPI001C455A99|nr:WD repeat-containing protein 43-like isoform X1 [Homarus americanus]
MTEMLSTKLLSFSPSGEKLAHSGPDGILRIWNTTSGLLEHQFQPAEHLTATTSCIRYCSTRKRLQETAKKKPTNEGNCLIAMGTLAGTIHIYCPERRAVIATLEHSPSQAILDVYWSTKKNKTSVLFSLSTNNTIMEWHVNTKTSLRPMEVSGGSTFLVFSQKKICLANRSIEYLSKRVNGDDLKVIRTFTGHTSSVTQLVPLVSNDGHVKYFLSSAQDDTFVYAWDTQCETGDPAVSFMVKDVVQSMAVAELKDSTVTLAVTVRTGTLILFTQHLNGNRHSAAVKHTGKLRIVTDSTSKQTIPIVFSFFCNDSASSIIVVYGYSPVFKFERIAIADIAKHTQLVRSNPSAAVLNQKTALVKTLTPKVTRDATIKGLGCCNESTDSKLKRKFNDEDGVASLPMEERLNALALDKTTTQYGTEPPKANNLVHLLLQGLTSKDQRILHSVFDHGDEQTISNTVRRLPATAVVPLLKHLQILIMGKGHKNFATVRWVRSVLYYHMSHLSTLPDREELMQPFYSACVSRMSTLQQVTQLHARLDLMLTHVATRHQESKQTAVEPEAILIYREESSDEDDMLEATLGVSESEDNWDELSDIGEINGHTDEDSDMEVDQQISSVKRRMEEEDEEEQTEEENDEENSDCDLVICDDEGDSE